MSPLKKNKNRNNQTDSGVISGKKDMKVWKGFNEYSGNTAYINNLENEFVPVEEESQDSVSRRSFLGLMASSMALAGVSGCKTIRRPEEKILPYTNKPEYLIPGNPLYFSSAMSLGEEVVGLVVESHAGRPTKIEGNKLHPASLGATNHYHQASLLELYDPERSRQPYSKGRKTWKKFWDSFNPILESHKNNLGKGLCFLGEYITSPSLAEVKNEVLKAFPKAKWYTYEPVNRDNITKGLFAATGNRVNPHYNFSSASVILSLDCDFLVNEINSLVNAAGFSAYRDPEKHRVNRLYMIESDFSVTGAKADHRLRLKPSVIKHLPWLIADRIFNKMKISMPGRGRSKLKAMITEFAGKYGRIGDDGEKFLDQVCRDLIKNSRKSLILAGKYQEPGVHALVHLLNNALGNVGKTVRYKYSSTYRFNEDSKSSLEAIRELSDNIAGGGVETLIVLGGNPVFTSPCDLKFSENYQKVKNTIHLGTHYNETSKASLWHLPQTHYLEDWSDALAYDGTACISQPLIAPLYNSQSISELLSEICEYKERKSYGIVKEYWKLKEGLAGFEKKWRKWLHDGVITGTEYPNLAVPVKYSEMAALCNQDYAKTGGTSEGKLEYIFKEDYGMFDGRFANNGWLQEIPRPMTRLTWDNAAVMNVKTAKNYGLFDQVLLKDGSGIPLGQLDMPMVQITIENETMELPVFILPGMSDDTVLMNTGYGRKVSGKVGRKKGFNIYKLQTSSDYWSGKISSLKKIDKTYTLACTQEHWSMKGRDIVRIGDINDEHHGHHGHGAHPSLWDEHKYPEGQQWGKVIDLDKCTGCGACVIACQAENNIPVVGKDQVVLNREMHWIRVDRYFNGHELDEPQAVHQPVSCSQCEMAPCETVCPVAATVHSSDGLNDMAYNRCVGTRYCANNCPYKVRRFNYFNLTKNYSETQKMAQNPDVTVRFRGVMEKCTYCVQRINEARIANKNKGLEKVPDGEIIPACAQVCPSGAITFGDINDKGSRVVQLKKNPRNYDLLAETNVRPRTSYLARVTNHNKNLIKTNDVHKSKDEHKDDHSPKDDHNSEHDKS